MEGDLPSLISNSIATFGLIITLVILVVALLLILAGLFVRSWVQRAAHQHLDKRLEAYRAQLAAEADSARAEYQRRLQELSLFSVDRHKAYATTFRRLLVAEGAWSELIGELGFRSDFSEADRKEVQDMMEDHGVAKPVIRMALEVWASTGDTSDIDQAVDSARILRAEGLRRKFRNTQLANDLYFSPEVRLALEAANVALSSLSASIRVANIKDPQKAEERKADLLATIVSVRDAMQFDLMARNELVPSQDGDPGNP